MAFNTLYALRALTGAPGFASARSVGRYAPSFPRLRSPTLRVALLATRNVAYSQNVTRHARWKCIALFQGTWKQYFLNEYDFIGKQEEDTILILKLGYEAIIKLRPSWLKNKRLRRLMIKF